MCVEILASTKFTKNLFMHFESLEYYNVDRKHLLKITPT
uniref:Uncharacterized protein n=1 Tax=Rhizophora mucronata TaxID=61149 RepID=A0A2P2JGY4_RHIMU